MQSKISAFFKPTPSRRKSPDPSQFSDNIFRDDGNSENLIELPEITVTYKRKTPKTDR